MPFQAYLPVGFTHSHESRMFEQLTKVLANGFGADRDTVYLIGNVMFEDKELDAVLLKGDALIVIEMKDYGGLIHFSENTEWFADKIEVKGGSSTNPYRQIRANRFALLNFMKKNGPNILTPPEISQYWHICGIVLFGRTIQFDEKMPQTICRWFTICDFNSLLDSISSFHTRDRVMSTMELSRLISCLELTEKHVYTGSDAFLVPVNRPSELSVKRLQVLYYNQSHFRTALLALRQSGGRKTSAAMHLLNLIQKASDGIDSFTTLKALPDARIENAIIYELNEEASFVAIRSNSTIHLCYCGTPEAVETWIQANDGLTLAVDGETLRIDSTVVTTSSDRAILGPTHLTEDNQPFLQRVKGLELETLVPVELIRENLLLLDENSSESQMKKVLDAVVNEDIRLFLHDIISLTKTGDIVGAEARIRLRKGEACPVVDAQGTTQNAITSDANSDQVIILNDLDPHELERLLDPTRFQEWMLFLHPDQRRVAEANFDRPVVLTGVSGSGKTCILVHRARNLARKYPGERIGILTLNRSLAHLLRNLVDQLCLENESKNIHVMAFYDYFSQLLHDIGPSEYLSQLSEQVPESSVMKKVINSVNARRLAREFDPLSGETTEDTWNDFYDSRNPELKEQFDDVCHYLEEFRIDASRYLREEFTLVRSAFTVTERAQRYTTFERNGRSIPLHAKYRSDILRLLLDFEEYMLAGEVLDVLELTLAVTPIFRKIRELPPEKRFRCLLVDEFQDLSTLDLRLLLWVPPRDLENALFLAGDPVQKILVKRLSLRDAGLAEGNAIYRRIKKNYRNSRQILRAASKLANIYTELANKSGEDIEPLDPELAVRETAKPISIKTDRQIKKAWEIARQCLSEGQTQAWTICIATASVRKFPTNMVLTMRPKDLQAEILSGDYIKKPDTIVVSTLNDMKGFEFNVVLIIGCDEGDFPANDTPEGEIWRDALRFYVCMTRARDQIYMLHEGCPSIFIQQMGEFVVRTEEFLKEDYQFAIPVSPDTPESHRMKLSKVLSQKMLRSNDSCIKYLSNKSIVILRLYYNVIVNKFKWRDYRGLSHKAVDDLENNKDEAFRQWVTPRNLSQLRVSDFAQWNRQIDQSDLDNLNRDLRSINIFTFFTRK